MLNMWVGIGEVTEVSEPKTVGDSGNQVLQFKFLTYDMWNGVRTDTTHQITVWGKNVTTFLTNFKAGDYLEIRGQIKTQSWIDKNNGERRYRTYVQANGIKGCDFSGIMLKQLDTNKETGDLFQ